ncbi:helix-turn-helix transcriptional regulator [Paraburkholderia fungorum]|uniref:Helix-turn-helix transcriptional regulator n=2 Tax=Paraburkholderia fungorum TaxID=134537 RepID=A0AAP5UVR9_9BURK|nr:helix-turn-helix transcriptional regulator [Paraburkholderia fungorum]
MNHVLIWWSIMPFTSRLIALRKQRGLSQQAMADAIGIHANSWKKYETAQAQPSIDVLKKIAVALHVSTDFLLFDEHERGPGDDFALEFEAIREFSAEEKQTVRDLLEGLILKHQARRWSTRTTAQRTSA